MKFGKIARMEALPITHLRLRNQRISYSTFHAPVEVVRWLVPQARVASHQNIMALATAAQWPANRSRWVRPSAARPYAQRHPSLRVRFACRAVTTLQTHARAQLQVRTRTRSGAETFSAMHLAAESLTIAFASSLEVSFHPSLLSPPPPAPWR